MMMLLLLGCQLFLLKYSLFILAMWIFYFFDCSFVVLIIIYLVIGYRWHFNPILIHEFYQIGISLWISFILYFLIFGLLWFVLVLSRTWWLLLLLGKPILMIPEVGTLPDMINFKYYYIVLFVDGLVVWFYQW